MTTNSYQPAALQSQATQMGTQRRRMLPQPQPCPQFSPLFVPNWRNTYSQAKKISNKGSCHKTRTGQLVLLCKGWGSLLVPLQATPNKVQIPSLPDCHCTY